MQKLEAEKRDLNLKLLQRTPPLRKNREIKQESEFLDDLQKICVTPNGILV